MLRSVRKNKSGEKENNQVVWSIKFRGICMKQHDIDFSPTDVLAHLICECKLSISKKGIIGVWTLSIYLSIGYRLSICLTMHPFPGGSSTPAFHRPTGKNVNLEHLVIPYQSVCKKCVRPYSYIKVTTQDWTKGTMLSPLWLCRDVTVPKADEGLFTYVFPPTPGLLIFCSLKIGLQEISGHIKNMNKILSQLH